MILVCLTAAHTAHTRQTMSNDSWTSFALIDWLVGCYWLVFINKWTFPFLSVWILNSMDKQSRRFFFEFETPPFSNLETVFFPHYAKIQALYHVKSGPRGGVSWTGHLTRHPPTLHSNIANGCFCPQSRPIRWGLEQLVDASNCLGSWFSTQIPALLSLCSSEGQESNRKAQLAALISWDPRDVAAEVIFSSFCFERWFLASLESYTDQKAPCLHYTQSSSF